MGKGRSKNKQSRSARALPRGIPQRATRNVNQFEFARQTATRTKHHVHNKVTPGQRAASKYAAGAGGRGGGGGGGGKGDQSSLARSIALRNQHLKHRLESAGKSNEFVDRRIGEAGARRGYDGPSKEDVMLKRIVRERVRRSKKRDVFRLDDEDGGGEGLTHRGKAIDESYADTRDVHLSSDDDEDITNLDTQLHFGGGKFDRVRRDETSAYGPSSGAAGGETLGDRYTSRRVELEERIMQKKMAKAEKLRRAEDQRETFEDMDEGFGELAGLLQFRDKEEERRVRTEKRKAGKLERDEAEMDEWDREMKEYLFERKVAATDRTKTPEEIAKESAKKLHDLETKRLARMAGDFLSDDELSDISDDEGGKRRKKHPKKDAKRRKRDGPANPEELSDSDDGGGADEKEVRFTADGLVYLNEKGEVVGKVGDEDKDEAAEDSEDGSDSEDDSDSEEDSDSEDDASGEAIKLEEGTKVEANYRASDQYGGKQTWYSGTITAVHDGTADGGTTYDITYDDGDVEEGVTADNVRALPSREDGDEEEEGGEDDEKEEDGEKAEKARRIKAKMRARESMPFVFEVPTTIESLNDLIAEHASTGEDASLIIQRIHAANSVRLDHRNGERMQNFYDALLRRFIAVGDAIFHGGNGGEDLGRYGQLDCIVKTLYAMSHDSPECAGAVWGRRLGIFQKAHSKRLRDVEVTPLGDACEDEFTAWPSTGTLLLLRALPHIFPPTDRRHAVVTPALILLGQILAQTPVRTRCDVVRGLFCSGLMQEYTKGAKRVAPEATAFLAGVLRLYADDVESVADASPMPSLSSVTKCPQLMSLRDDLGAAGSVEDLQFSLEKDEIQSDLNPAAILSSTLHFVQEALETIGKSDEGSEREIFNEVLKSLLLISVKRKGAPLPQAAKNRIAEVARAAALTCASDTPRLPLQRRKAASVKELAIKTLAPRMEDPSRYSMSKDKGKSAIQAEHDRHRREYKREKKAVIRELRLDGQYIESERRKSKGIADNKAREKRYKNHAWLEAEQATMNQQVRQGGGLLSGGGVGAARAKAKSGKLGIKKGGKF